MRHLVSGVFTALDSDLFSDLFSLWESEGIEVEPSAAAVFRGPHWLIVSQTGTLIRSRMVCRLISHTRRTFYGRQVEAWFQAGSTQASEIVVGQSRKRRRTSFNARSRSRLSFVGRLSLWASLCAIKVLGIWEKWPISRSPIWRDQFI
jgi:hypothetical protein